MTETLITSSIIILVIIVIRRFLRGKIGSRAVYALWLIAAARLLMPSGIFASSVSVMNTFDGKIISGAPEKAVYFNADEMTLGDTGNDADYPQENTAADIPDDNKNINYADIAGKIRLSVSGMLAVWFVSANIVFYRKLKRSRREIDYAAPLKVYITDEISTPCVFGLLRPAVYVTEAAAENKKYLHYIVTHEVCHYYHGDTFRTALRYGLLSAYWFDPFVWAAVSLSKRDCECACDEAVIKRVGYENRLEYGRTLIEMIPRKNTAAFGVASTSMSAAGKILRERITLISSDMNRSVPALIMTLCAVTVTAAVTFTSAEIVSKTSDDIASENIITDERQNDAGVKNIDISVNTSDLSGSEKIVHYLVSPDSSLESYIFMTDTDSGNNYVISENTPYSEIEFDISDVKKLLGNSRFSKAEINYSDEGENVSRTFIKTNSSEIFSRLTGIIGNFEPVYDKNISAAEKYITVDLSRENGGFSSALGIEFVKTGGEIYGRFIADDFTELFELIMSEKTPSEEDVGNAYSHSTRSVSGYFKADDTALLALCRELAGDSGAKLERDLFSGAVLNHLEISEKYPAGYSEKNIGSLVLGVPSDGNSRVIGSLMLWRKNDMSLKIIMDSEAPEAENGSFCGRDAYYSETAENGKFTAELFVSDSKKIVYKAVFESDDTDIGRQTAARIFGTFHI